MSLMFLPHFDVAREVSGVHNLLFFSSIVERLLKLPIRYANLCPTGHATERADGPPGYSLYTLLSRHKKKILTKSC